MRRSYESCKRVLVTGGAGFLGSHLMFNVVLGSREEIVHADNLMAVGEQSID